MRPYFILMMFTISSGLFSCETASSEKFPLYDGADLGCRLMGQSTQFKLWAPSAEEVELILYTEPIGGKASATISMKKTTQGVWEYHHSESLEGQYYVYRAKFNGKWNQEVPDPYAMATAINGRRTAIISLSATNPQGWEQDKTPTPVEPVDAIIYELHVRDASIHSSSGISQKGKFLGLAEYGTQNSHAQATGIDHIKELGITHVHLLPFFDFLSIDETRLDSAQYNWGYEPLNYNVPEGSYSTLPHDPSARIRELKQMVMNFHNKDLRVVMDVVYNHTMLTEDSWFNQLVPDYFYRKDSNNKFSNATACGNEIASERPMVRKYIIESLEYWMKEYHIDGFRFDLMGVHDITLMQEIEKRLKAINPHVLLYGEGWAAGSSPIPEAERALKKNVQQLNGIAVFSDDLRDAIKGSVFVEKEQGFVSGRPGMEESIKFGVTASCEHPQVNYEKVNYSKAAYSKDPSQTVTYVDCHDNNILWDKIVLSTPGVSRKEQIEMHKQALGIVLTSQGIPFIHAGTEFMRSKQGNENSYNAGDSINAINWNLKWDNKEVYEYIRSLIQLRKTHPAFRLRTGEQIKELLRFYDTPEGIVAYSINGEAVGDSWREVLVIYKAPNKAAPTQLTEGFLKWNQPGSLEIWFKE